MSELGPDDLISLHIGRAAREAVNLELMLQRAYKELAGYSYGEPGPTGVSVLVDACMRVLPDSYFPTELHAAAYEALASAKSANQRRNRLIHDLWRPAGDDPTAYVATKFDDGDADPKIARLTIEEFAAAVDEVKIAAHRVAPIYWITSAIQMDQRYPPRAGGAFRSIQRQHLRGMNERLLRGDFRLNADGEAEWDS